MTNEEWSRIAVIVDSALSRDDSARPAFIAEACGADAELRREVESLLARFPAVDDFLKRPAADLTGATFEAHPAPGDRFGPYVIESSLGAGGMGEVYRARDRSLDRAIAIKMLPRVTADAERIARFEREARILASLNHPRIGAIYGFEHADGVPGLILELVEGPTLAERLASGPLSISGSVAIAIAILEALEAAHDRGIIHRDIKPANVKITPGSGVKVLDFGLAKELQRVDDTLFAAQGTPHGDLSSPGSIVGTVAYMSPEQARGEAIDARADLFSLGAVLYEMVTGRRAFLGTDASRVVNAILHDRPPSPRMLNPTVPHALERVIVRLLEPRSEDRYQTASDVRIDLQRIAVDIDPIRSAERRRTRWRYGIAAAVTVTVVAGLAVWMWPATVDRSPVRSEYTQITHFADSATSPALSRDGRLLTFVRGASTFEGPGQIYVKELPEGEALQLTSNASAKMNPVFSPDGSRIAYTSVSPQFVWDTWSVGIADRTPRFWLANASGLTWTDPTHVLFSEIDRGLHMQVVSADDKRQAVHVIYSPEGERGMAHQAYRSPDGKWLLVTEMDQPVWKSCRLVPMNGAASYRVGPNGQCTSAAWSPDGKWMYFSSNGGAGFHIWRQRFQNGVPEQISFGPGEEEGVAVLPDGKSLLTSVGNRQSSVWVADASGEREVSPEGYAFIPAIPNSGMSQPFSADRRLLYLVRQSSLRFTGPGERAGELWATDLQTSQSEALFPGVQVTGYDMSHDGKQVAFTALDTRGASHIWIGPTDHRTPPRQLSSSEADSPRFGASGSVYYRGSQDGLIYRVSADGDVKKIVQRPVLFLLSVSPDEAWVVARVASAKGEGSAQENLAFPSSSDAPPIRLCDATCEVDWAPNGKSLVLRLNSKDSTVLARTIVVPLRRGETLPSLPPSGIRSEQDLAALRISRVFDGSVYPANDSSSVAFVRSATQRNIYRIPLRPD